MDEFPGLSPLCYQNDQRVLSFKGLSRDTYSLLTVPSKSQPLVGQHMQSKKQLSLRRSMETDLPRTQLSLLVGYGNPHSAAVPRTLADGKRDKSLISSCTRGNCPLGTTFTKSSEQILLLLVGFLGTGAQHVDSPTYENLICYICTLDCATAQLLIHIFFTTVDAKSFQQVAFNFLMSIQRDSAGLQHLLCLHRQFLF